MDVKDLVKGMIDPHIHTAPDIFNRCVDDVEAAEQAKAMGMRAIMIKCHCAETASRARIASKVTGLPVFGGIALNYPVGGLNHHAVDAAARLGARVCWMPTFHAAQYLKHVHSVPMFAKALPPGLKGISLLDPDGNLVPEVEPILDILAKRQMVLATGHISSSEALPLVGAAIAKGIKTIVITHASADFLDYTTEMLVNLAKKGVLIEHNYVFATKQSQHPCSPKVFGDSIRAVGVEHCFIGTDGGQAINPPPTNMLAEFIQSLYDQGFTRKEIETLAYENPARMLGL
ncbi:MAG: DUF6282 family protein [Actinobacteria bacterium]|nr:DUF6282 family protein [Actinomycetota bacterium]